MKTVVLVDDGLVDSRLLSEHGLSVYFELNGKTFLFDTGSTDLFTRNAKILGIDISKIDTLFLSHGHRDHTGGLPDFLRLNDSAVLYATPTTFQSYFALRSNGVYENIGTTFPQDLSNSSHRIIFTKDFYKIDENLLVFSNVPIIRFPSEANNVLFQKKESCSCSNTQSQYQRDTFRHELNLFIKTPEGKKILLVGCSHCGIVNIIEKFIEIVGTPPDVAIGGFHLSIPSLGTSISNQTIDQIANQLASWSTRYYTGHCTGTIAFERVQSILGDRITRFGTGSGFEL